MKTMNAKFMSFDEDDTVIESDTVRFLDTKAHIKSRKNRISLLIGMARVLIRFTKFPDQKIGTHVKTVINKYIRDLVKRSIPLHSLKRLDSMLISFTSINLSLKSKSCSWMELQIMKMLTVTLVRNPAQHEGYVMTNKYGTYKLVKREIFSYNNFNATKNWSK